MEHSLSSLSYKGSITEAIAEAKQQKKLFVVYISDDNSESKRLEATWIDPTVSETLLKHCILLHILEGSSEARNFSEIYPQKSVPCITVVGYNGVQLWKNEGFVTADVLASSLQKAWLSLHVQETTAAFLTAALASGNQFAGETSASLGGQVSPAIQLSVEDQSQSPGSGQSANSETIVDSTNGETSKKGPFKHDTRDLPKQSLANNLDGVKLDDSATLEKNARNSDVKRPDPNHLGTTNESSEGDTKAAEAIMRPASVVSCSNTETVEQVKRSDDTGSSPAKPATVVLNVRLPDGSSSQLQFSVNGTLGMVKDQLNRNEAKHIDSFYIAIPYPRKNFKDEDMSRTLSELGFFSRQALILVPRSSTSLQSGGESSHHPRYNENDTEDSNASEGYWASLRRILSYANPFSYITRKSISESVPQESLNETWQHRLNPNNTFSDEGAPRPFNSSGPSSSSSYRNNRKLPSRFGANIHTLRNESDDDHFDDRNTFWNGNSTQFGGNDDGK